MRIAFLLLFVAMVLAPRFFTWAVTWRMVVAVVVGTLLANLVFRRGR